jgi:chaperone modulatory protein CbpM
MSAMTAQQQPSPVFEAVVVEQEISFTLIELCHASQGSATQLLALVDEGVLDPAGSGPTDWVFDGRALHTARTALRLSRDLALGAAGTALVLDLLAENERLRSRLRAAQQR